MTLEEILNIQGGSNMTGTDFLRRRHSSPYCCWRLVNFSGRDVFSNEEFDHNALFHAPRYLLFAHHFSNSQTGLNRFYPSRREGGGCGFTLSRSHSCCAVRLVYIQISPGHIWTTLYVLFFPMTFIFHKIAVKGHQVVTIRFKEFLGVCVTSLSSSFGSTKIWH